MKNGGKRPGAGRKPGSRNKRSLEFINLLESEGITALGFMRTLHKVATKSKDERNRVAAASAALPYLTSRQSSVEMDLSGFVADFTEPKTRKEARALLNDLLGKDA